MQVTSKQITTNNADVVVTYTFDSKHEVSIWNNGAYFAYDKKNNYATTEESLKLFKSISKFESN
jgi:hypothetical protein